MRTRQGRIIGYTAASHALVHLLELSFAAVLVSMAQEYGSGLFVLGMIANAFALAFGAGALPAGLLTDRIGSRRLLVICFLAAALFCLVAIFSPSLWLLGAALVGLGAAIGLYHPGGLAYIAQGVSQPTKGFAYHGMAGNLGVALAPLLGSSMAALWGWRSLYLALGVASLVLAGAIYAFAPRREDRPPQEVGQRSAASAGDLRHLVVPLLLLYTAYTLTGFIYRGVVTFLPLYMRERVSLTIFNIDAVALAGSFTTVALLFGIAGQYLGGALAQRIRLEHLVVAVSATIVPALLFMGLSSGAGLVVFAAAFAFFNFMGQPVFNSLIAKYTPLHLQGRSYGISFFCAFGLGSFSAGFSGFIAERVGANWVFLALATVALLLVGITAYFLKVSHSVPRTAFAGAPGIGRQESTLKG